MAHSFEHGTRGYIVVGSWRRRRTNFKHFKPSVTLISLDCHNGPLSSPHTCGEAAEVQLAPTYPRVLFHITWQILLWVQILQDQETKLRAFDCTALFLNTRRTTTSLNQAAAMSCVLIGERKLLFSDAGALHVLKRTRTHLWTYVCTPHAWAAHYRDKPARSLTTTAMEETWWKNNKKKKGTLAC